MRLGASILFIGLLHAAPAARQAQDRPLQADGIVRLLLDLEHALTTGSVPEFREIATATIPQVAVARFGTVARGGADARAIVRERSRLPIDGGYDVIADVLLSRGPVGRVATWVVAVTQDPAGSGQYRIADFRELAAVDGLLQLALDTTRQFHVKDLVVSGPDLTVKMSSGSAFVAESPNGITALVLRGRGEVHFAPPDPAEQVQVQLFSKRPALITPVDSVFVRVNPAEFAIRVTEQSLTPTKVDPAEASRALAVFDDLVTRTYNVDLRALTPERWSLEPSHSSLVVEFRTPEFGWLTYAKSPADNEDISLFDRTGARNISLYASADKLERRGRFYSDDNDVPYDVEHHRLDLSFDPARLWVSGRASLRVRITASSISTLTIKLAHPLAVASVSSPGLGDLLALRIVGQNSVLVGLPTFVERGSQLTLDVVYGGRLEPQPPDREAMAPQGQARLPDPETLILTPEPRFMYSNRVQWYPQGPFTDYATAEMRLTVPSEYQVVATGSLLRQSTAPNRDTGRSGTRLLRVSEYATDRPVRYLACVISRFVPLGRTKVEMPPPSGSTATMAAVNLEVVATSRMTGRNRQTPQRVSSMLQFFARTIGEAPYPDFTLAALDDNLPGGHSPAYFAAFNQPLPTTPYSWANDPVAFDQEYQHFFLAHEVAHQWWGQAIGWKNYHDQWLSEGLAQYFAALYAAEDRGPALLQTLIAGMRASSVPLLSQGPISLGYRLGHVRGDGRAFRAVVYNKAAVVMHMLRRLIGDEAFFAGVRRFYAEWRFKKAGTQDLQAAFEAETPMKLDRFFDGWVRGFGVPHVRLTWTSHTGGEGDQTTTIRVEQTGEVFDFPLGVAIQYADGRTEERTLKITDRIIEARVPEGPGIRRISIRDPTAYFATAR